MDDQFGTHTLLPIPDATLSTLHTLSATFAFLRPQVTSNWYPSEKPNDPTCALFSSPWATTATAYT